MKIVIAPDSFKESLSAMAAAAAIEAGFRQVFPDADYVRIPLADGGEGTVDALAAATGGTIRTETVCGPLGRPVEAVWGMSGDGTVAVIEMAAAAGLMLVAPDQRDPRLTTTRGVGELILAALDRGCRRFIIGIGGSATNDAGAGLAEALGARLLDAEDRSLEPGGGALSRLARIDVADLDRRLAECVFDIACDVDNPLTGPTGASAVFGPQKGATPAIVAELDTALAHWARIVERDLGVAVADLPGAGAAGGLGAALVAFVGGRLRPGAEIVTTALDLDAAVADADLVITGEGRIDGQTVHGKTPVGVALVAARHGRPVIGIAGWVGPDAAAVHAHGIDAVFGILPHPCRLEDALAEGAVNLTITARNIAAALKIGRLLAGT